MVDLDELLLAGTFSYFLMRRGTGNNASASGGNPVAVAYLSLEGDKR